MTAARSFSRSPSPASAEPERRRAIVSFWRTVPTRHGTHCPQDSSRKKAVIRSTMSPMSVAAPNTVTAPEPSVRPAAPTPSKVSATSPASWGTKLPAAPPSSTAPASRGDPASSNKSLRRVPNGTS